MYKRLCDSVDEIREGDVPELFEDDSNDRDEDLLANLVVED